jgi:hypothetical protein
MCNTNQEKKHRFGFGGIAGLTRFFGAMIFRLFFVVVFALVLAVVVMWLWNWLMPGLLGAAAITYWQAFGLMILARLVLGTLGMGWKRPHWHGRRHGGDRFEHYRNMCGDMGRSNMCGDMGRSMGVDNTMKWWHNYKSFWHDEGKAAFDAYMKRAKEGEPKGKTDKK